MEEPGEGLRRFVYRFAATVYESLLSRINDRVQALSRWAPAGKHAPTGYLHALRQPLISWSSWQLLPLHTTHSIYTRLFPDRFPLYLFDKSLLIPIIKLNSFSAVIHLYTTRISINILKKFISIDSLAIRSWKHIIIKLYIPWYKFINIYKLKKNRNIIFWKPPSQSLIGPSPLY